MSPARSLILRVGVRSLFHTVLVFSLYLLFAGHNAPGGGFVGGLVAGIALVLRFIEGGDLPPYPMAGSGRGQVEDLPHSHLEAEVAEVPDHARPLAERRVAVGAGDAAGRAAAHAVLGAPARLLGTGLILAAGSGAAALVAGREFLASGRLELHLPVLGTVKASSTLVFDTGVYLIVVGLVLGVLAAIGREPERAGDGDGEAAEAGR